MSRKWVEAGNRIVKEMVEDKTQKIFCKVVHKKRKKKEVANKNIIKEEWLKHFKKQFNGMDTK